MKNLVYIIFEVLLVGNGLPFHSGWGHLLSPNANYCDTDDSLKIYLKVDFRGSYLNYLLKVWQTIV